jgi:hypothetical protein
VPLIVARMRAKGVGRRDASPTVLWPIPWLVLRLDRVPRQLSDSPTPASKAPGDMGGNTKIICKLIVLFDHSPCSKRQRGLLMYSAHVSFPLDLMKTTVVIITCVEPKQSQKPAPSARIFPFFGPSTETGPRRLHDLDSWENDWHVAGPEIVVKYYDMVYRPSLSH